MEVILISDYRKSFRQGIKQYISMDKNRIISLFKEGGIDVKEYHYEEIINNEEILENNIIIYTSSQNFEYKQYIDDILFSLSKRNTLIPRYEIFKAHENKGYQEILRKELGIWSLKSMYFGNVEGLMNFYNNDIDFPLVLKKVTGAGSSGVYKSESYNDLIKKIKHLNRPNDYLKYLAKKVIKKFTLNQEHYKNYFSDDIYSGPFILQRFVKDLTEDWKVLIFGNKYYVLNRAVRKNDFRASGSGNLSYVEPPQEVLDFANEVFQKLDTPNASLDIAFDNEKCHLIEFQGIHFGPYTIINSDFYYEIIDGDWSKVDKKSNLEEEYTRSMIEYIDKKIHQK